MKLHRNLLFMRPLIHATNKLIPGSEIKSDYSSFIVFSAQAGERLGIELISVFYPIIDIKNYLIACILSAVDLQCNWILNLDFKEVKIIYCFY